MLICLHDPPSFIALCVTRAKCKYLLMASAAYRVEQTWAGLRQGWSPLPSGAALPTLLQEGCSPHFATRVMLSPLCYKSAFRKMIHPTGAAGHPASLCLSAPHSAAILHLIANLFENLPTECLRNQFSVTSKASWKVSSFSWTWWSVSQSSVICFPPPWFLLKTPAICDKAGLSVWAETERVPL